MREQIIEVVKVVACRFFLRVVLPCFVILADKFSRDRFGRSVVANEF
jgi:hypothetical protein